MSVSLAPLPVLRFVDNSGNALVGGKVFTYLAGTTTKQNTYTDSTGSTPNTNPIILNSRGECNCWLLNGIAYKIVLSPSTDTDPPTSPIWTVDNITVNAGQTNIFNVVNYGAVLNGSTSDRNALQSAINAASSAGGGTVFIPTGTLAIDSTADSAVTVPNNVTIMGAGQANTIVKVINSVELDNLFTVTNPNNVWFTDLTIYGNSTSALSAGNCGAIYFHMDTATKTANCQNFGLRRVTVTNFKQAYWVYAFNEGNAGGFALQGFTVDRDCTFISLSGNLMGGNSASYPSTMIAMRGSWSGNTVTGGVINTHIAAKFADGTFVKRFVDCWSATNETWIDSPYLISFGANASSDSGAYSMLVYDDSGAAGGGNNTRPQNVWFQKPSVINPLTCGIYCASGTNVTVEDPFITGQSDTTVPGLLYGAIVFNHTSGQITNPNLTENYRGICFICGDNGAQRVTGGTITSTVANAHGVFATSADSASGGFVRILDIEQVDISMTGSGSVGVRVVGATGAEQGVVRLSGRVAAVSQGLLFTNGSSSSIVATSITIQSLLTDGAITGQGIIFQGTPSVPTLLSNVTLDATNYSGNPDGIVNAGTSLQINGLTLKNFTVGTGHALNLVGATGTLQGVQFVNVSSGRRATGSSLGLAQPAYSWDQGGIVQNLSPVEAGSAASKYVVWNWINTDGATTWLPGRQLTGN